jgi:uncharacterized delta-60 repeat protein
MDRRMCAGAVGVVAVLVFALFDHARAAAGALDPTFGIGGKVRTRLGSEPYWAGIFRLLVREDGRILAVGYAEHAVTVVRYLPDGTVDESFGSGGMLRDTRIFGGNYLSVAEQPDGMLLIGGEAEEGVRGVVRYTADGAPDLGFSRDGFAPIPVTPHALAFAADGRVVVAGYHADYPSGVGVSRLHADGAPDGSFGFTSACAASATPQGVLGDVRELPDGAWMGVGWSWSGYVGLPYPGGPPWRLLIARFLADGSFDPAFGTGGVVVGPDIGGMRLALQPDGKILGFEAADGDTLALVRFLPDGTPDSTFGVGGRASIVRSWRLLSADALVMQPDGKILVAGTVFSEERFGDYDFVVARLSADGTIDATFGNGGTVVTDLRLPDDGDDLYAIDDWGTAMALQPDGRIVVAGTTGPPFGEQWFGLTRHLDDACGDGVPNPGEACDDGAANGTPESCCTTECATREAGTECRPARGPCDVAERCTANASCPADTFAADGTSCDTGDRCRAFEVCTAGACTGEAVTCPACTTCDPAVGCVAAVRGDCGKLVGGRADLGVRRGASERGHRLSFRWREAGGIDAGAIGNPSAEDDVRMCVFGGDPERPALLVGMDIPAGGACGARSCWRRRADGKLLYKDAAGVNGRVTDLVFDPPRGELRAKARGAGAVPSGNPAPVPLLAQVQVEGAGCWEAQFGANDLARNDGARITASTRGTGARGRSSTVSGAGTKAQMLFASAGFTTLRLCELDPDGALACRGVADVLLGSVQDVAVGDLDGDGDLDAALSIAHDRLGTCLGDGAGAFTCRLAAIAEHRSPIAVGDVNGDGRDDVVARDEQACLSDDAGGLTCQRVCAVVGRGGASDVAAGDLDEDGRLDLVLPGRCRFPYGLGGDNCVCFGNGAGGFDCEAIPQSRSLTSDASVAVARLDGDTHLDVVFGTDGLYNPSTVCLGAGDGGITGCLPVDEAPNPSPRVQGIVVGDFTEDGIADLVFARTAYPTAANRFCAGIGDGTFACRDVAPGSADASSVASGDVDGDGHLDLAFARSNAVNHLCTGDGAGNFACRDLFTASYTSAVAIGRFTESSP